MSKMWLAVTVVVAVCTTGVGAVAVGRASASTTIVVTTTADDLTTNGNCTLREALLAADTNQPVDACLPAPTSSVGTVLLPAGIYKLRLGELPISSNLSLVGSGTSTTIIDGGGASLYRYGIHVMQGVDATISQLTIQLTAGAVRNDGAVTLTDDAINDNGTSPGFTSGTILASAVENHGTATIDRTVFSEDGDTVFGRESSSLLFNDKTSTMTLTNSVVPNSIQADTSWVLIENLGTLTVKKVLFADQLGWAGGGGPAIVDNQGTLDAHAVTVTSSNGGLLHNSGTATVSASNVTNNAGSAIYNSGTLHVTTTNLLNNTSHYYGAIENTTQGTLQLTASTVAGNTLIEGDGVGDNPPPIAAAGIDNQGKATIVNDTVVNNTLTGNSWFNPIGAGGIANSGSLTARNLTIVGNKLVTINGGQATPAAGGLIEPGTAPIVLANTVIAGNTAGGAHAVAAQDCTGEIGNDAYVLIQNPTQCSLGAQSVGLITGKNPKLGPLTSNGGLTLTEMPQAGSSLIDKGNPASPGAAIALCAPTDQRGVTRPRDGNGDGVKRCDIGAVER